jgi:hypothetical protein
MTTLMSDIVLVNVITPIRRKPVRVTSESLMKSLHTILISAFISPCLRDITGHRLIITPSTLCYSASLPSGTLRAILIFVYYLNNIFLLHIQVDLNFNSYVSDVAENKLSLGYASYPTNISWDTIVRTSKRTPYFTITKINWLILFKEITAVYNAKHMKAINRKCDIIKC